MTIQKAGTASNINNKYRTQRGFSAVEVMVAVAVITVIAGIVIPNVLSEYEKARVSACNAEIDLMKTVALNMGDGKYIPTPEEFWGEGFPSAEAGEYYYIVDNQDANKGHGNDLDGCDEDNPGSSPGCLGMDIKFVVFCAHDHGEYGEYVYATEKSPPTVVLADEEDPYDFKAQKDMMQGEDPKPEGKKPKAPKK